MQKPTLGRDRAIDFQATPMIDVVFLLIIFFLVSSHLASQETPTSVNLPIASVVERTRSALPVVATIDVTAEGELVWDRQAATVEQVADRLRLTLADSPGKHLVRIRADRATPYEAVETLLLACQRSGVTEAAFSVIESPHGERAE